MLVTSFLVFSKMSKLVKNASKVCVRKNAIKRLMKDFKRLSKTKSPGFSASPLSEDDLFMWHGTVEIQDGNYEGCRIHLIIRIPENYPHEPPSVFVHSGQPFNHKFHDHIYQGWSSSDLGFSVCADVTANFHSHFEDKIGYGWSPGCTLEDLLLNLQIFFSSPDYAEPTEEEITEMKEKLLEFECDKCKHTSKVPYPPIIDRETIINQQKPTKPKTIQPISKLVCSITKQAFNDQIGGEGENDLILGYPLYIRKDRYDRMHITPVLELISYEAFVTEIQKRGEKLDDYESVKFRSATGHYYNHWLPIYINKNHFEKGKDTIQNSLTVIRYGIEGTKENDFTPDVVLKVLPTLLNKTILALMKKDIHGSTNAIEAYSHFLRLFMAYIDIYPELLRKINKEVSDFMQSRKNRNKKVVPDLGEFIVKLFLSRYSYNDPKIKQAILEEHFARQMYWIFKEKPWLRYKQITPDMIPTIFKMKEVSCKMLMFNLMAAQFFIKPFESKKISQTRPPPQIQKESWIKIVSKKPTPPNYPQNPHIIKVKKILDQRYGFPPQTIVDQFQDVIQKIHSVSNYKIFLKVVKWDRYIKNPRDLCKQLFIAKKISEIQGYTGKYSRNGRRKKI